MTIELLLAATLVLSAQGPPPRDGAVSLNVTGRVLDSQTGQPVAGALVTVMQGDQSPTRSVEAGAQGEFDIREVPRGAILQVGPPPMEATHVPRFIRISGAPNETAVVNLERALAITGRVVNEFDEPMAGVRVVVQLLTAAEHAQAPREFFSNDRGAFRLFGLASGRYRVCAMPEQPGGSSTYASTCLGAADLRHGLDTPDLTLRISRAAQSVVPTSPSDTETKVTIRGRVVDEQTRSALPGALVWLRPTGGRARLEAVADNRGQFELHVSPAPYDLHASAGEFKTTHASPPSQLLVMAGDLLRDVEIALPRAAQLEGVVTNTRKAPLADVVIELVTKEGAPPLSFTPEPTTDDLGRFRLHGIPSGVYTVCATPRSGRRPSIPGENAYARTCFPFAMNLRGTDSRTSIQLERLGTFSIRGTVLGAEGTLPPRLLARLLRVSDGSVRSTTIPLGPDGAFGVVELPPGLYEVTVLTVSLSRPPSSDPAQWGRARIQIVDRDVTDVVVQLTGGATVRGRVFIDDPHSDRGLRAIEVRAVPPSSVGGVPSAPAVETDDDGLFALKGVFGPAVVRVRTPDRYAVKSIRYAGRDITDVPVEFTDDANLSVDIVLSPATSEIAGRVLDDVGRPAEDAGVLYFPADPARWKAYEGGLRQQSIGGRYRIDKIPGGDYLVIAVRGPRPGWTEKDYAALAPLAERVTLGDGERRVLDLRAVTLAR